jgi:hypothetical protein
MQNGAPRKSVFDRLGPVPGAAEPQQEPKSTVFDRLGPVNNEAGWAVVTNRRQRRKGGKARVEPASPSEPAHKSTSESNDLPPSEWVRVASAAPPPKASADAPRGPRTLQTGLLQRALDGVQRERSGANVIIVRKVVQDDGTQVAMKEMEQKVAALEAERAAAQELADQLLLSQQALLQEKSKIQAEKERLARETAALTEQIEFLQEVAGGGGLPDGLPGGDDVTTPFALRIGASHAEYGDEPPITPTSAMMRALLAETGYQASPNPASPNGAEYSSLENTVSALRLDSPSLDGA